MLKKITLLVILAIVFSNPLVAQEEDSTETDEQFDSKDYDDFGFPNYFEFSKDPMIEASYGGSKFSWKSLQSALQNGGFVEMRIGYSQRRKHNDRIFKLNKKFITVSGVSQNLGLKANNKVGLTPEFWKIGVGLSYGYGYKIGRRSITPYSSNSFIWSNIKFKNNSASLSPEDSKNVMLYNETLRFGTATQAGIEFSILPLLTLNGGYERSVIFPRYLFWKHAGSMFVEFCEYGLIDHFVKAVLYSFPTAAPAVDFFLKNVFSFAMYELRKEKMNWPFKSASPLTFDTWKIGLTARF